MSNRFYRAAGEENSDTEEDNSNESGSDEEVQQKAAPVKAKPAAKPKAEEEESDDEAQKSKARQVVSAKEKKMAALLAAIKALRNALKIGNWVKVLSGWDEIEGHVTKLAKEPEFRKEGIPKVYWQQMLALDALIRKQKEDEKKAKAGDDDGDDVKGVDKKAPKAAAPKKMNAEQARAQTRLHSNLKKLMKQHDAKIEEYKKAPLADDAKLEDAAAAGAGEDAKPKKAKPAPAAAAAAADDDDGEGEGDEGEGDDNEDGDEGEDGGQKDDSDAEFDSDSDDEKGEAVDLTKKEGKWFNREFWMKKPGAPDSDDEAERKKKPTTKRRQGTGKKPVDIIPTNVADEKKAKDADFTPELIMKRLNELVGMRGKKGTDRKAMIADLQLLATKTVEPAPLLKVLITLCSALFDITLNADTHMPIDSWLASHKTLLDIIKILDKEALVRLSEDDTAVEESFEQGENEDQKLVEKFIVGASAAKVEEEAKKKAEEEKALKAQGKEMQYVMGNLYSFVDRMASEFKKSLQNIDPHTPDYVARLKHEPLLLELIEKVQAYYFKIQKITFQCKVVLLRLEHVYYRYNPAEDVQKPDALAYSAALKAGKAVPTPSSAGAAGVSGVARTPFGARGFLNLENPSEVQQFATFLYKHADDRSRMRALLYHVFYLSIHNRYAEARDLLLMSHVQDGINDVDIYTRIIFNRTMAQLGLCAFRVGEYRHSLYCLMDLHQSKSIKELIAQGTSSRYFGDRDVDKERIERKRVYPYHQHMSLDVLESVHLLSAMFIEVPNLAIYGADNKRRIISKPFRRLFDHHQRQAFNGPPENTRDLIMAATKALRTGEWAKALKLVMRLKMWELIPNAEYVKSMVTDKIKEEALRTYLFTYATQYVTISLHTLMSTFDLNAQAVYRITSKMMINEQLAGTWDQPTASIVMHAQEPTPLQRAALKFADKAGVFLEQNERVGEQRASLGSGEGSGERRSGYGGYGSGYQRAGGDGEHHHEGGRRNYRGGGGRGRFPSSRLRGGRGGGGGGGGERHSAAADD